jgi:hypothetical protein
MTMRLQEILLALAVLGVLGCDGQAAPPPLVPLRPSASVALPDEPLDKGIFVSKRFGLRLPLPNGAAWKIDDRSSRWLEAKEPTESASLLVRLWRDENRMTREKCEATARSLRKLPLRDGAELVDSRRIDVPPGFDTQLDVALVDDRKGGFFGFVLAFGGVGRRCFAYVYATHTSGAGADREVGDRLAKMVEGSLQSLTFESDLDVVLEREGHSPSP